VGRPFVVEDHADRLETAMNRSLNLLTKLTLVLAAGECLSAVTITVEDYAGSVPAFAVLFAGLFFTGAWLLHRGRVTAGATLVGLLTLFEIVTFPGWQRQNAYDWVSDTVFAALSVATLVVAVVVPVRRRRLRAVGV
jgi:hypothetical protein